MVAASATHRTFQEHALPVRRISAQDLRWALAEGWRDFKDRRGDVVVLGFIYPVVGIIAFTLMANRSLFPMIFPAAAGLAILGPVVASGFYELARRRETGLDRSWRHFFRPFFGRSGGAILGLGIGLAILFAVWIGAAWGIYAATLGTLAPASPAEFLSELFTTGQGWALIVFGNLAGLVFAAIALAVSLVSFPMVVDRGGRPFAALETSIEAALRNPKATALWGVQVAVILAVASIPLFIGLALALPVLGYATWHLYTRLVER
jgi:uncharacterized membrane protein